MAQHTLWMWPTLQHTRSIDCLLEKRNERHHLTTDKANPKQLKPIFFNPAQQPTYMSLSGKKSSLCMNADATLLAFLRHSDQPDLSGALVTKSLTSGHARLANKKEEAASQGGQGVRNGACLSEVLGDLSISGHVRDIARCHEARREPQHRRHHPSDVLRCHRHQGCAEVRGRVPATNGAIKEKEKKTKKYKKQTSREIMQ